MAKLPCPFRSASDGKAKLSSHIPIQGSSIEREFSEACVRECKVYSYFAGQVLRPGPG
jgi:hypothetical protein